MLLLILVAPILLLWWLEKGEEQVRIRELKNAFVEALKETGLAKDVKYKQ